MTGSASGQGVVDSVGRTGLVTGFALAGTALLVSAYLTVASLEGGVQPPGCGAGSACEQVLTSPYSRVAGIAVSAWAMMTYALMLPALAVTGLKRLSEQARGIAWLVLIGASTAIVAAAAWFVMVQWLSLGAWCRWCLVSHVLGLALAAVVLTLVVRRRELLGFRGPGTAAAMGVAAVMVMGVVQVNTTPTLHRLEALELELDTHLEPRVGDADTPYLIAAMVDYACPVCRRTHQHLMEARDALEGRLAIIVLPMPLHSDCNPYTGDMGPRFAESCELAMLALAVHRAEPGAFEAFDRWMFESESPRRAEAAHAYAAELVGATALGEALASEYVAQTLARNVEAYGGSEADRIPVLVAPPAAVVVGGVTSADAVLELLDEAAGDG